MPFQYQQPYASARLPLFARNVVATSHPLAVQAGLRMLWQGGNAVDAAVAAAAAMTVCEPTGNGLGSDAFCILWDGQSLHGLNASGRAPLAWTPDYFHRKYGEGASTPPRRGIDAVTVPGAVSAWVALSERFGKLPFADLMAPAAEIAERGYAVPVVVQGKWAAAVPELQAQPGFAQSFLPRGRAPHVGELFTFPAAARALRAIGATRGEAFYTGEIAQALARFSAQHGGALTLAVGADIGYNADIAQLFGGFYYIKMVVVMLWCFRAAHAARGELVHWHIGAHFWVFPHFGFIVPVVFTPDTAIGDHKRRCVGGATGLPQLFHIVIHFCRRQRMFNGGVAIDYHA